MLFYIYPLDLVDTVDGGDAVHGGLKLVHRVDFEVDGTYADMVSGLGPEAYHGKTELFSDAVHKVAQKMVSVNRPDAYTYRIKEVRILLESYIHNRIAFLGSQSDGCRTVPLVHLHRFSRYSESDDLIPRKRMTVRTAVIDRYRSMGKV